MMAMKEPFLAAMNRRCSITGMLLLILIAVPATVCTDDLSKQRVLSNLVKRSQRKRRKPAIHSSSSRQEGPLQRRVQSHDDVCDLALSSEQLGGTLDEGQIANADCSCFHNSAMNSYTVSCIFQSCDDCQEIQGVGTVCTRLSYLDDYLFILHSEGGPEFHLVQYVDCVTYTEGPNESALCFQESDPAGAPYSCSIAVDGVNCMSCDMKDCVDGTRSIFSNCANFPGIGEIDLCVLEGGEPIPNIPGDSAFVFLGEKFIDGETIFQQCYDTPTGDQDEIEPLQGLKNTDQPPGTEMHSDIAPKLPIADSKLDNVDQPMDEVRSDIAPETPIPDQATDISPTENDEPESPKDLEIVDKSLDEAHPDSVPEPPIPDPISPIPLTEHKLPPSIDQRPANSWDGVGFGQGNDFISPRKRVHSSTRGNYVYPLDVHAPVPHYHKYHHRQKYAKRHGHFYKMMGKKHSKKGHYW